MPRPASTRTPRRADAERSVARILDAAVEALASDPEASMAAIARRAGVVRATIYVHFPTREALIEAVTKRAIAEATAVIAAAEPERGDPREALRRVLLEPLIQRGQRAGAFRAGVPAAWHLAMVLALIHAASAELSAGRMPAADVEAALVDSALAAVGD